MTINQKWPWLILLSFIPAVLGAQGITHDEVVNKRAKVLNFLTELSFSSSFKGAISGQNCFHGDEITSQSPLKGFQTMVQALNNQTGKWPGILGVDYEWARSFTPAQLSAANQVLKDYAAKGGILAITFTPQNPWFNDEGDLKRNPGSPYGPSGTISAIPKGSTLDDLWDKSKAVSKSWLRKIDRIAAALKELRDAGAVVLFRPMQEMNGNWFWWGISSHPENPEPYVRTFRRLHDYFQNEKALDNLIWVYSPVSTYGNDVETSTVFRAVDWAYPGDSWVDVIAGTNYADDMQVADYSVYVKMGKPLGMGEFGPVTDGPAAKAGSWDTSKIIERFRQDYPRFAFWVCWHAYPPQQNWSMVSNRNAANLLNDPQVINREDLPWNQKAP